MNLSRTIQIFVITTIFLAASVAQAPTELTISEVGNVLYCLDTKLKPIGYAPPHFNGDSFRVRYALGVVDKEEDKQNELHLIVYGKEEKTAALYEIYLDNDAHPSIYIGEMGTLKKEKGAMEPDEIWGGVGTYHQVKRLLRVISRAQAITIPTSEVIAGSRVCVFQQK